MMRVARSLGRAKRGFATAAPGQVGFIGLGQMGSRMAANVVKAGHRVMVFDTVPASVDALVSSGASAAESIGSIAKECDTVITMLPASKQVKEVYLDSTSGLLANAKEDTLFIDCTTMEPDVAKTVAAAAAEKKMHMVDAPVSGGVGGAEAGTLSFMVGGTEPQFERAKVVLDQMGKNIVHCGDSGKGQVAKICNNLVLAITMIGLNEGYNLALTHGMNPETIANIFNSSSAQCWSSGYVGTPGTKDYNTGFKIGLMSKDLGLAISSANEAQVKLPLGEKAAAIYSEISNSENVNKDFSYVLEYLKDLKE